MSTSKTFVVTATPPTTNGDLHVGHLSGPYLAADVFVRFQKLNGHQAYYFCSGDDHQSYVATTAKRRSTTPEELARISNERVQSTLQSANMALDFYTTSLHNQHHIKIIQQFFVDLYERGVFKQKTKKIPFCASCDRHLFEAFARGKCPYCGEGAAGNLCEACGRVNDPADLHDQACGLCGAQPEMVEYTGLFLPLEEYRTALAEFYNTRTSWRPHLLALCRSIVANPIPDYPVTYPANWGIPVPVPGFEGQVLNVWFEMYPGHFATTQAWAEHRGEPELARRLWSGEAELVQFLGYDNGFFNGVLFVALAMAAGSQYLIPEHLINNEFYYLDGSKFSTSRGHAIWGTEILAKIPADALRYYVSRTNPEHTQTNFIVSEFCAGHNGELVSTWNPTINGFFELVAADFGGQVPTDEDLDLQALGLHGWAKRWLERFYDTNEFSLRHASATLMAYVEGCRDYLERSVRPIAGKNQMLYRSRIYSLGLLMKGLALFSAPLIPAFAQQLWAALGMQGEVAEQRWESASEPLRGVRLASQGAAWFSALHEDSL